ADPALRLVLHGAGAAFDPLLSGDAVAVGEILDCVGTAASQQHEQERSSHTLSTECTPGMFPMARRTSLSCFTSAISTSNVLTAPWSPARAFAWTMFTPTSAKVSESFARRPFRSSLLTLRLTERLNSPCTSQAT